MPTPQVFLDELPLALPTLRHVLESEHEWEDVLSETWKQLIAAAHCTCYPTWHHPIVPFILVGPSMLRFPVSLLTATALIEAIKRVIHRRLSRTKLNAPAESLKPTSDRHIKHAAAGIAPPGSILKRESSDVELGVLRATSAVSGDIREVLDLSTVTISYILVVFFILMHLRRRLMSVKNGSNRCDRLPKSQFARSTSLGVS
jgi:hypothetical protein